LPIGGVVRGALRSALPRGDALTAKVPIIPRLRVILKAYIEHARPALLTQVYGCLKLDGPHSPWRAVWWENGRQVTRSTHTYNRHDAQAWLEAHAPQPAVSPFVFVHARTHRRTRDAEPLLTRTVWDIVNSTAGRLLAKPLHPHALRHSFAFRIRENDGPIELIQEALGHASIQTTMIYAHISSRKRRADLEKYLTAG
jgi:integrase